MFISDLSVLDLIRDMNYPDEILKGQGPFIHQGYL